MNRLSLSITLLIFSIFQSFAQKNTDAETIINNSLSALRSNAVKTNFQLSVTEKNAVTSQPVSGSFTMKASKFVLEMNGTKVWFDGKTQWNYSISDNEVSITEPDNNELAAVNPMAILAAFKAKSAAGFSKIKSSQNYVIDLIPKNKKEDIAKVEVQINKTTGYLVQLKMLEKSGKTTVLTLSKYQQLPKITDDTFVFNKNKYKNVVLNDLR